MPMACKSDLRDNVTFPAATTNFSLHIYIREVLWMRGLFVYFEHDGHSFCNTEFAPQKEAHEVHLIRLLFLLLFRIHYTSLFISTVQHGIVWMSPCISHKAGFLKNTFTAVPAFAGEAVQGHFCMNIKLALNHNELVCEAQGKPNGPMKQFNHNHANKRV